MSLKLNDLVRIFGVELIQKDFNAHGDDSRNVRRRGEGSLAVEQNINQPIFDFDVRRGVQQANNGHNNPSCGEIVKNGEFLQAIIITILEAFRSCFRQQTGCFV